MLFGQAGSTLRVEYPECFNQIQNSDLQGNEKIASR
jgi:hypothetical protein